MSIFKMADLSHLGSDFKGPIMGSLKRRCATSYTSSIDTIALNCLVFLENRIFAFGVETQDDR